MDDVTTGTGFRTGEGAKQWGSDAVSTALVGIPGRKEFYRTLSKSAARERCGVAPQRSTILMMAGGMGPGRLDELILELDRRIEEQAQIIAIAHDRVLLKRICKLQPERLKVRALGWTEHVHFFMAAADLLITKPGALTLSEAIAMNLPVIAFGPLPGPKKRMRAKSSVAVDGHPRIQRKRPHLRFAFSEVRFEVRAA